MVTRDAFELMQRARKYITDALVGRRVRVLSDHNGQLYGRSRRSWRGEIRTIVAVRIDLDGGIQLCLEGHEYESCISADEVEFVS